MSESVLPPGPLGDAIEAWLSPLGEDVGEKLLGALSRNNLKITWLKEPEVLDAAGVPRKAHYGEPGKQPWDIVVSEGWAPEYAAGNVLKYVRRAHLKGGDDDIKKARWFWARLVDMRVGRRGTENPANEKKSSLYMNRLTTRIFSGEDFDLLFGPATSDIAEHA